MSTHLKAAALGTLLTLAACAEQDPLAPEPEREVRAPSANVTSDIAPAGGPWARIVEGRTGPGSLYAVYVPREWNGDVITYAHGMRDATTPVDLRDQDGLHDFRDQLGTEGYAVAYSSYASNGFAIKDGVQRTHQLRGLVASLLGGQPKRTFLVGHSLGALVALNLTERFPEQYSGALLMCGMVGGSRIQTDYLGHVRTLADHFFPGSFAGSTLLYPADQPPVSQAQVVAAVMANPMGLFAIASTSQARLHYLPIGNPADPSSPAFQTMVGSLVGALNFHSRGINDVVARVGGASPFGNVGVTYSLGAAVIPPLAPVLSGLIAQADANVSRYTMDAIAAEYLAEHYEPTGALRIPVITIHNAWDPGVPTWHHAVFGARVAAAGATELLQQRIVPPGGGHCAIPPSSVQQGVTSLVRWASTGAKPAS